MKLMRVVLGLSVIVNVILALAWRSSATAVEERSLGGEGIVQQKSESKSLYAIEKAEFKKGSFKSIQLSFLSPLGEFAGDVLQLQGKRSGTLTWLGAYEARFDLDEAVRTDESVIFSLDPAHCPKGWELAKENLVTVSAEGFQVLSCEQTETGEDYAFMKLTFNSRALREELAKNLQVYSKDRHLAWQVESLSEKSARIKVKRGGDELYYLKFKKEMKNAFASSLKEDSLYNFRFGEDLEFSRVEARNLWEGFDIKVYSNMAVDYAKLKDFIEIKPAVDFYIEESWNNNFYLRGQFESKKVYEVLLKKGLLARGKQKLEKDSRFTVKMPAYRSRVQFLSEALYLPETYEGVLPVKVTAMPEIDVKVHRIYENNLVPFLRRKYERSYYAELVKKKSWKTGVKANSQETLNLQVGDLLKDSPRGLYCIDLKKKGESYGRSELAYLIRTDLALTFVSSDNQSEVLVTSISKNEPVSAVKLQFLSRKNQLLAEGMTDEQGIVRVSVKEDIHLVTAKTKDDFSFIEKSKHRVSLYPFALSGVSLTDEAYEGSIYPTRSLCRPGEKITFSGALRKADGSLPEKDLPIEFLITDLRNKIVFKSVIKANEDGVIHQEFTLEKGMELGTYEVLIRQVGQADSEWGRSYFRVAAYQPDRFKAALNADLSSLLSDGSFKLKATAQYYFGRAVAATPVKLRLNYSEQNFNAKNYEDYSFVDEDEQALTSKTVYEKGDLSEKGEKLFELSLPKDLKARSVISVRASVDVQGASGRSVTARERFLYHPYKYYLGLKENSAVESLRKFSWVTLNPKGETFAYTGKIQAQLLREDWHYVYREDSAGIAWHWQKKVTEVKSFELESEAESGADFEIDCPVGGVYILKLESEGQKTALRFYHQYGDDGLRLKAPDYLKLTLNAQDFKAGEEAELKFYAYQDALAYLNLAQDDLLMSRSVKVKKGENTLRFTVPEVRHENIYVSLTLQHDRTDSTIKFPRRLFGLTELKVRHDEKKLSVTLENEAVLRSAKEATIKVQVLDHLSQGKEASVHLFAVDRGLLALSPYRLIDQHAVFYGSRRWSMDYGDLFDNIYPDEILKYRKGSLFGGGGYHPVKAVKAEGSAALLRKKLHLDDMEMEETAFFDLGILKTDKDGHLEQKFKTPDFNGELQFFALAVSDDSFGQTMTSALVRDPITVQSQMATVLAPSDKSFIKVVFFNNEDSEQELALTWQIDAYLKTDYDLPKSLKLAGNEERVLLIPIEATKNLGPCRSMLSLKTKDYEASFPIFTYLRSLVARESRSESFLLKPGEKTRVYLAKDWYDGSGLSNIAITSNPFVKLNNYAAYLSQYPYGCLEQTVSKAFPQLYLQTLAIKNQQVSNNTELIIQDTIKRILNLYRTDDAAFSMWQGGGRTWHGASIYAAHFLSECLAHTYEVPEQDLKRIIKYLKRVARGHYKLSRFDRAYALYVLSTLGEGQNILAEEILKNKKNSQVSRLAAAAALLRTGRSDLAKQYLPEIKASTAREKGFDGLRFSGEATLWQAICDLEMDGDKVGSASRLQSLIEDLDEGGFYVTYRSSMLIFACGRWAELYGLSDEASFKMTMNDGEENIYTDSYSSRFESRVGDSLLLENTGEKELHFTWQGSGIPKTFESEALGEFLSIERSYLDEQGRRKESFKVGDLVTVSLKLKSDRKLRNVVIVDLLAGAFRIEDDSLATRASNRDAKLRGMRVNHQERLDDRLLIFADLSKSSKILYSYQVRVVAEGNYAIPAVSVESMYKPELSARSEVKGSIHVEQ